MLLAENLGTSIVDFFFLRAAVPTRGEYEDVEFSLPRLFSHSEGVFFFSFLFVGESLLSLFFRITPVLRGEK